MECTGKQICLPQGRKTTSLKFGLLGKFFPFSPMGVALVFTKKVQKLSHGQRGVSVKCGPDGGGWQRMADGGWRTADGVRRMADNKMRMAKCEWQNADDKMRMIKCG